MKYIIFTAAIVAALSIGVGIGSITNNDTAKTVTREVPVPTPTKTVTAEPEVITITKSAEPAVKASEKPVEAEWTNPSQKTPEAFYGHPRKPETPSSPSAKSPEKTKPSKTAESKPLPKPDNGEGPVEGEEPAETEEPAQEPSESETPNDRYAWLDKAAYEAPAGWGGFTVTYEGNFSYVEVRADGKVYRSDVNAQWVPAMPGTYTVRITPYNEKGWGGIDWELQVVVPE